LVQEGTRVEKASVYVRKRKEEKRKEEKRKEEKRKEEKRKHPALLQDQY
jgi:hypothetical protein